MGLGEEIRKQGSGIRTREDSVGNRDYKKESVKKGTGRRG